ncbi:ABC transporter membrane subunit [Haloferax elongans ATCC BAA-1513]|uniref:ABC transporter membrane subunit n=1 Tax=Haloferax elongans ATCC BAA-1513 TaxID=1230453 RepID=M0HB15_HALEO|nr:ABC transporter permease [Haloferax elongans]ELZ80978.1 ABC transporter membrane subunit [Haloferax elongans ATCC BAA-1513]
MKTESTNRSEFGSVPEGVKAAVGVLTRSSPVLALLFLWQALGFVGALPVYVPAPTTIVNHLFVMFAEGTLIKNAWATLQLVYVGFFGGAALGIVLGVLTGRITLFGRLFDPLVSMTYPIPKIALFPIFVIWFGIGFMSKAIVVFLAAFYPVYIHTFDGVRGVPELHVWSAQNFDASRFQILTEVVIPDSLPQILSGLRVGLALAFIVVFSAELIQSDLGLGQLALQARQFNNYELMFSSISVIALFGVFHDRLLLLIRRRLLYYQEGDER